MRFLRWQADLLKRVEPEHQLIVGVIMVDLSLLYVPYYFMTSEPLGIYSMSAFALFFAGMSCAWTAEVLINQKEGNNG
jgi:hypothetical protein